MMPAEGGERVTDEVTKRERITHLELQFAERPRVIAWFAIRY